MDRDAERLLEPCKAYDECYKALFSENAGKLFEKLVAESGINADENRRLAQAYREADGKAQKLKKKLSHFKTGRVLLIILACLCAVVAVFGISEGNALLIAIPLLVLAGALVLIFTLFRRRIKELSGVFSAADEEAKALYAEAMASIAPLLDRFDTGMTADLIMQTVPTLRFDKNFDMRRYDYLSGKYGYGEDDGEESSMQGILSGEIIGNPFVFERKLNHHWGQQVYTGSLTIHWTTYHIDSNGHRVAEHHTQTLYATVTKPRPFFAGDTRLVYGNEAAPDLSFTRQATHAEQFSANKLKSFVRSREKKIRKLAKENMDKGFTELGNEEFDALFGAFDRDHEVQFRLLFTPLAQKNLLKLMKGGSPYGDDFALHKSRQINIVHSEHAQGWEFNVNVQRYQSYDVDLCRAQFLEFNEQYFRSVYFDLAPLLSIPLYQQIKPKEYIYQESYHRNYTVREAEVMANRLGDKALAHAASVTPAILKTRLLSSEGGTDKLMVHALSYRTVHRVDFVPVWGGDGRFHDVPVPWLLYIPLSQETQIELKGMDMSEWDYRHSDYAKDTQTHTFYHSIFATLGEIASSADSAPDEKEQDISEFGEVREEAAAAAEPDEE